MKKFVSIGIGVASMAAMAALMGCHSQSAPPADQTLLAPDGKGAQDSSTDSASDSSQQIVALVRGHQVVVTRAELDPPLMAAYGLNILIREVTLDLAKEQARSQGIVVTDADIANERKQTLQLLREKAQEEQNPNAIPSTQPTTDPYDLSDAEATDLLQRLLAQEHVTEAEFDLTMQTNAYLRKIAQPLLAGRITDDMVRQGFNALYGEKALVRVISCSDPKQAQIVMFLLKRGDSFEACARNYNADPRTQELGGEYPPFTRQDPRFSQSFKSVVFGLTEGQYFPSVIQEGNFYDVVKLEKLIPPSIVKFDDYKDEIRQRMFDEATRALMQQYSNQLGAEARNALMIKDPVLAQQFANIVASQHAEVSPEMQKRRWDAMHGTTTAPAEPEELAPPADNAPAENAPAQP